MQSTASVRASNRNEGHLNVAMHFVPVLAADPSVRCVRAVSQVASVYGAEPASGVAACRAGYGSASANAPGAHLRAAALRRTARPTLRSSGPPPARHLARATASVIIHCAGQVPCRWRPLSSNVGPHSQTTCLLHHCVRLLPGQASHFQISSVFGSQPGDETMTPNVSSTRSCWRIRVWRSSSSRLRSSRIKHGSPPTRRLARNTTNRSESMLTGSKLEGRV